MKTSGTVSNSIKKYARVLPLTLVVPLFLASCNQKTISGAPKEHNDLPNIVIFYVDDLGFGDLSSYGAQGVSTPNVDHLAKDGIRFSDAHTTAATCTPSRYSLLTGEYAFRKKAQVLRGDATLLIDPEGPTLPKMLKKAGYKTAVVGKWHLGLGAANVGADWNGEVKPGPIEVGFDYSFLLPATGDRVPTVYLENHHVVNLDPSDPLSVSYIEKIGDRPTGTENPELLRQAADPQHANTIINGISRIGWMAGGKSAEWVDEDFHQVFTQKAQQFISENKQNPFFLFFSFHDIHVPRLPAERFRGVSEMGLRGDAIVQMDWITGEVINELKRLNLYDNTLIIFSSDNGAILTDGYDDQAIERLGQHKPNGVYRGGKYSAYEAGTRVPMIVSWPEHIEPGVSDALISQVDVYASLANLLGIDLGRTEAIDSKNMLAALSKAKAEGRQVLLEQSYTLSLRDGVWKYIRPTEKEGDWIKDSKNIESGLSPEAQLFKLDDDPGEQKNLAQQFPERVAAMEEKIVEIEQRTARP